jgi:hypothetical protein
MDSRREAITNLDFVEEASDLAERYGSTPQGVVALRQSLLNRCSDESKRELLEKDPALSRLAILLYNKGLKQAGIDDEMLLHYHFTSQEGADGIDKDSAIKAVGKTAFTQVKEAYNSNGVLAAFKAFLEADNLEAVGIHAAAGTRPEIVRSLGENVGQVFLQRLRGLFGISHSLGIKKANLKYFFEIISAKSDKIFHDTAQSPVPFFDLDEVRAVYPELKLGENSTYAVVSPYKNSFIEDTEQSHQNQ